MVSCVIKLDLHPSPSHDQIFSAGNMSPYMVTFLRKVLEDVNELLISMCIKCYTVDMVTTPREGIYLKHLHIL
jgi:hypothetical protein